MGFGKDGKGVIIVEKREQALGTLAQNTGILIATNLATLERFRMLKTEVICTLTNVATTELGGIVLYLADGDLTLAEIEEAIETEGPLGPNDQIAEAIVMRPVFRVGAAKMASGAGALEATHLINDEGGPLLSINPRWTFARTKSWNWVIYNNGPAPTTGTIAKIMAKNFGIWVT